MKSEISNDIIETPVKKKEKTKNNKESNEEEKITSTAEISAVPTPQLTGNSVSSSHKNLNLRQESQVNMDQIELEISEWIYYI